MTVAELIRNLSFVTLTNYAPFIYVGTTKYRSLKTEWGTSCDDLFDTGARVKVKQVTRDYLNKYIQEETLAECIMQEGSFYFDRTNQLVYIHIEHDYTPLTAAYDYGYTFGTIDNTAGGKYIDDYFYEPVIKGDIDISRAADDSGVSQPKGSSSSITFINTARYNEITKKPEGVMDFVFTEKPDHNDVFIYNYENNVLTPLSVFFVADYDISEKEITLNLQDKRFS